MNRVIVDIREDNGCRATEIVADLRNVAEVLFHPMRCVGFWDTPTGGHICPQGQRQKVCPHQDKPATEALTEYRRTVENDLDGFLEVVFSHASVYIYLA